MSMAFDRRAQAAAFAEGRRQRAAAERLQARMEAHQARHAAHWARNEAHRARQLAQLEARRARRLARGRRRHLAPLLPIVFILLLVGLAKVSTAAALVLFMASFPALLIGFSVFVLVRHQRRSALRRGGAPGTAPLPARPAAPPRPDHVWSLARQRFTALRGQYGAFECDPMAVLRLPALTDVTVPSTGRFVDAFAEAQALETEAYPHEPFGAQFVAAVDRAERAWRAAREAAERIRLSGLTPGERATVEKVVKLLTTARDSDSEPERIAAYAKARQELAKLDRAGTVHLPRPAAAALDAAGRGALPA